MKCSSIRITQVINGTLDISVINHPRKGYYQKIDNTRSCLMTDRP